tara:strand:- start:6537 stop:9356 length:2820 start_codon:yes stop_codon:yes gene_type:complete
MPSIAGKLIQAGGGAFKLADARDINIIEAETVTSVPVESLFVVEIPQSVTFSDYGATVTGAIKATKTDHGIPYSNLTVYIKSGQNQYNGYHNVIVIDDDNFYFLDTFYGTDTTGFFWGAQTSTKTVAQSTLSTLFSGSTGVSDLTDTTITDIADNDILAYDSSSSKWINQSASEAGLATTSTFGNSADGLVPNPGESGTTKFLRQDGSWIVPTDTQYSAMGSGNSYAAGLVLSGSATHSNKFLRKDGTWQTVSGGTSIDESSPILDSNDNELIEFEATASAVNHIEIINAATGYAPMIEAVGSDTDIGLQFGTKGTEHPESQFTFNTGSKQLKVNLLGITDTKKGTFEFGATVDRTWNFPDSTGTVVLDSTISIWDDSDPSLGGDLKTNPGGGSYSIGDIEGTDAVQFKCNTDRELWLDFDGTTSGKRLTLISNVTDNRSITFPDTTGEIVLDSNLNIQDDTSPTLGGNLQLNGNAIVQSATNPIILRTNGNRDITFDFDGATSDKTLTLVSNHTDDRTLTLPDYTGTLAHTDQILIKSTTELEGELANIDSNITIGNHHSLEVKLAGDTLEVGSAGVHSIIQAAPRSGPNLSGYRLQLYGGASTGSSEGGNIVFNVTPSGSSGSDLNNFTRLMAMNGNLNIGINATSKLCFDGVFGTGGIYIVNDQQDQLTIAVGGASMLTLDSDSSYVTVEDSLEVLGQGGIAFGDRLDNDKIYNDANGILVCRDDSDIFAFKDDKLETQVPLFIAQSAAAVTSVTNYGQLWVKNNVTPDLYYTNESGQDIQITSGDSLSGGGASSEFHEIRVCNFYSTSTGNFVPLPGYVIERTSTTGQNEYIAMVAPYDGEIIKASFRSEVAMDGDIEWKLYKSADQTEVPGVVYMAKDSTVDIADDITHHEDFTSGVTGSNSITKGEIIALKVTTPVWPGDTNTSIVFKWDSST